jgi:hypothetical protein
VKVGDLVKRRNNGDLALVIGISKKRMKIVLLEFGDILYVWDYEYEVMA